MFATEEDGVTPRYPDPGGKDLLGRIQARDLLNVTMFGSDANWTVGGVKRTLLLMVQAMLELDFTDTQVCRVLGGTARELLFNV
jgi:hypothetical protein